MQTREKKTFPSAIRPNNALLARIQQRVALQSTTYETLGVSRSCTAASSATKYHVRDARRPCCILPVQIDTKQLLEQQSVELTDSTKRRRLRWCCKFSSSKQQQHSVQVHSIRKLSRHDTFAEMPYKCQLSDGTRTASEADVSVFQL